MELDGPARLDKATRALCKWSIMEFRRRLRQLQQVIREHGLAGAILFHSRDIFYYTGTAQPAVLLVLPDECSLLVRRGIEVARKEAFLEPEQVCAGKSLAAEVTRLFPGPGSGEKVGTELDLISFRQARQFQRALGDRQLVDISGAVLDQRMVKDRQEIQCIRKACTAVHAGHLAALSRMRPGITELELAAAIENAQRLAGHEGYTFLRTHEYVMSRGPLASGPNLRRTSGTLFTFSGAGLSSAVPTGPSRREIQQGDLVLVDIPSCIGGYHADQSRTYCLGTPSAQERDWFERLRAVSDTVMSHLLPGVSCAEIYNLALRRAEQLGMGDAFMRFESGAKAHFIGHGVGLEINEPPLLAATSDVVLQERFIVALEMHLVTDSGLALKLEDTVLVGSEGAQFLTESPRDLIAVPGDW